jgi:hypothetical protein
MAKNVRIHLSFKSLDYSNNMIIEKLLKMNLYSEYNQKIKSKFFTFKYSGINIYDTLNPINMDLFCHSGYINNLAEKYCDLKNVKTNESEVNDTVLNTTQTIDALNPGDFKVHPKFTKPDIPYNLTTIDEFREQIQSTIRQSKDYFKFAITLFKKLIVVLFLMVFLNSKSYHNKYLKSISYDNIYITSYFRRIDARRKHAVNYIFIHYFSKILLIMRKEFIESIKICVYRTK